MTDETPKKDKTLVEEVEVAGGQLIDRIKAIIQEGNVRQIRLWVEGGDFNLELPMTVGVIAGGALVLTAPWLAILGVIAAMVTKVKIEIEREDVATPAIANDTLVEPKPADPPTG